MRDCGLKADATLSAAEQAVKYLLDRIQHDPDLRWICGPGTEAFHLLCVAEAARLGRPLEEVELRRREDLQPAYDRRQAELPQLREEVRFLRDRHNDWDSKPDEEGAWNRG